MGILIANYSGVAGATSRVTVSRSSRVAGTRGLKGKSNRRIANWNGPGCRERFSAPREIGLTTDASCCGTRSHNDGVCSLDLGSLRAKKAGGSSGDDLLVLPVPDGAVQDYDATTEKFLVVLSGTRQAVSLRVHDRANCAHETSRCHRLSVDGAPDLWLDSRPTGPLDAERWIGVHAPQQQFGHPLPCPSLLT